MRMKDAGKEYQQGSLVGYFVAGYPDQKSFLEIVKESDKSGIDIFEIGFASMNPYADGTTIRNAHEKVDKDICTDMAYWHKIRKVTSKPIWVMAYKADLVDSEIYLNLAKEGLIDAIVIPDCTQEERREISIKTRPYDVNVLGMVNPAMQESEWKYCFENFRTVYLQLYSGPTGMSVDSEQYHNLFEYSQNYGAVKCFAGFGIKTPEKASHLIKKGFTGVVIGTAIIDNLNISPENLYQYIGDIKTAIKER
jgi:tryptophan synthase alpha chain